MLHCSFHLVVPRGTFYPSRSCCCLFHTALVVVPGCSVYSQFRIWKMWNRVFLTDAQTTFVATRENRALLQELFSSVREWHARWYEIFKYPGHGRLKNMELCALDVHVAIGIIIPEECLIFSKNIRDHSWWWLVDGATTRLKWLFLEKKPFGLVSSKKKHDCGHEFKKNHVWLFTVGLIPEPTVPYGTWEKTRMTSPLMNLWKTRLSCYGTFLADLTTHSQRFWSSLSLFPSPIETSSCHRPQRHEFHCHRKHSDQTKIQR